jgi:hypothetical protein
MFHGLAAYQTVKSHRGGRRTIGRDTKRATAGLVLSNDVGVKRGRVQNAYCCIERNSSENRG